MVRKERSTVTAVVLLAVAVLVQAEGESVADLLDQGMAAFGREEFATAEERFRAAREHPKVQEAQRTRAGFYLAASLGRQEKYAEAIKVSEAWVRENPEDERLSHSRFFLGLYHQRLGNMAEARKAWGPILREEPDSVYADLIRQHLGQGAPRSPPPEPASGRAGGTLPAATEGGGYLVVRVALDGKNREHMRFGDVAKEIVAFHKGKEIDFDGEDFAGLEKALIERLPENVLFVVPPEVLDVRLHRRILLLSGKLDEDVFPDFAFGYFTARDGAGLESLWARTRRLHEKGLPGKTWISAAVTSGPRAIEHEGRVPTLARAAGFTGTSLYYGFPAKDENAWEFLEKNLPRLQTASVITMTGNGDPEGIWIFDGNRNREREKHWPFDPGKVGQDPKGEMSRIKAERFRALTLMSPIVWSGTCHSGATCRVYVEGDIVSTFGRTDVATVYRMPPERSLCLALLDAGAAAFLCPIGANHGYSVSVETEFALRNGASLGETIKSTWDDVWMAAGGELLLDLPVEGEAHRRSEPVMQGAGANRALIGDPSLAPFKATKHPTESVEVTKRGKDGFDVVVTWEEGHHWRGWDIYGVSRSRDWRVWTRVPIDDLVPEGAVELSATLTATGKKGEPLPYVLVHAEPEEYHGRRFLHLQANGDRKQVKGRYVRATFSVRIGGEEAKAGDDDWLGHAKEVGENLLARLDEIETEEVYSGRSGVALFLFDLFAATSEERWLKAGKKLLDQSRTLEKPGLYTGVAGVGQVALDAWRISKDKTYLETARASAKRLGEPEATDVIYGAAGTGIFLLNLAAATKEGVWLEKARELGEYLEKHAVRADGAASWPVAPGSDRIYLGFSHGAAGIGYFLLHLHLATGEKRYRERAEEAARFVLRHAVPDGEDGLKWTKMEPARKEVYPLQWCHGSPGMGLFFLALSEHLGGKEYEDALARCIASDRREGRTYRTDGSQCHGVAGNAELLLEAYRLTKDESLLEAARVFARDLVGPEGVKTKIGEYTYDPSYMTGLAGIGRLFLRLADPEDVDLPMMVRGR